MAIDPNRLKELFFGALEQPAGPVREDWLAAACGGDRELRQRLEALTAAHDHPATALALPFADVAGAENARPAGPAVERAGQVLAGRYKLLEQVGSGGMGSVWVADQLDPVRRRVAIKLIKAGMDSVSVLARFDAERQALALMDHPHIARVLDGGMTEAGRPFFVMDLVKGLPITRYCDENRLSVEERLRLFIPVCQAVQHAHQKGIIHRDLKPSNILVCLYDGQPVPKVIDFGLAKAIHQPLGPATVYTSLGVMLGTPLYMSPEQAEINNLDVDTRSDVYALGVLLYELLTGTTPLEKARFEEAAWQEMLRLIREEDPLPPSLRLSGSGALPSIAAQRHVEPQRLTRQLRGELDWIVMKCLEKDRARRYDSASGLAGDLQHFLADEIVVARPPSAWYRWQKFFRRNRGRVVAAGMVLLALVAGMVATSLALLDARTQRARADLRLNEVGKANAILAAVFADLNPQADSFGAEPLQAVLGQRLELAAQAIDSEAIGDPLAVARVKYELGRSLHGLGFADRACPLLEEAHAVMARELGPAHADTTMCLAELATSRQDDGAIDVARDLFERLVRLKAEALGDDHPDTLKAHARLAEHHRRAGRLEIALPLLTEAHERQKAILGPEHPETITSLNNRALGYLGAGQRGLACQLFHEVLRLQRQVRGPDHAETVAAINNLANALLDLGRETEALPLLEEVLQRSKTRFGTHHSETFIAINNLAGAYWELGQLDRAIPLYEDLHRQMAQTLGAGHADTLLAAANLGSNYQTAGRHAEALPLLEEAFAGSRRLPQLRWVEPLLAEGLVNLGRRDDAIRMLQGLVADARRELPPDSPELAARLARLGWYLVVCSLNAWAEAEPVLREAMEIRQRVEPDLWTTFNAQALVGQALLGLGRHEEAEPLLLGGVEGMFAREATIPPEARGCFTDGMGWLVQLYTELDRQEESARWREKLEAFLAAGDEPADDES